jgi:hypothetical protein
MFDSKCLELAEHFLPSAASKRLKDELAQTIQDAVETYIIGAAAELQIVAYERTYSSSKESKY